MQLICLTPTRNEVWIIDRFLAAASRWADHIIVADQNSTDGTVEHIRRTERARLVVNDSVVFNEPDRQKLLIDRARMVPGRRVFLALDADEALSANATASPEWDRLKDAAPGTILRFRWVNVLPGFRRAWIPTALIPCGFVDDGRAHVGTPIHSPRIPYDPAGPFLDFHDVVVLHFQYVAWERMASKHRWYQAWEFATHGQKRALDIFREYHHMHGSWDQAEVDDVLDHWLDGYERAGIDYRSLTSEPITWWDRELVSMLTQHGAQHFRRLAIWNTDWNGLAATMGLHAGNLSDPRSLFEKAVHRILGATQARRDAWHVRVFERGLRGLGW